MSLSTLVATPYTLFQVFGTSREIYIPPSRRTCALSVTNSITRFDLPTVAVARVQSSSGTPAPEPIVGHRGSRVHHRASSMLTYLAPHYDTAQPCLDSAVDAIVSTGESLLDVSFRGRTRGCIWYTCYRLSVRVLSGTPIHSSRSIPYKHQVQLDGMTNGNIEGQGHRIAGGTLGLSLFGLLDYGLESILRANSPRS